MSRDRTFMDLEMAKKILDEIAVNGLTDEPIQLHLMGEPLLHPQLFEIIRYIHNLGHKVRLFTNGALLDVRNRKKIYDSAVEELVIGIHTYTESLYQNHRKGKPDFFSYMNRIQETIAYKFQVGAKMQIFLQYLNTKHFNRVRLDKAYPEATIPLIDTTQKANQVIDEWKDFGNKISKEYNLGFEPIDLECLQGEYRDNPLDCLKGNHCEILPGVILQFKDISSFSDYLMGKIRYVERYKSSCNSFEEQMAVLANGDCTPCCVDYDGKLTIGNVKSESLLSLCESQSLRDLQHLSRKGLLPTPICRICKGIIVNDDYQKKIPGCEKEPYELEFGWYPLESDEDISYRWTGKRAALSLHEQGDYIEFEACNSHPYQESLKVLFNQGENRGADVLEGRGWKTMAFKLQNIESNGSQVFIESEIFWIPAELIKGNEDWRELGIKIKNIRVKKV